MGITLDDFGKRHMESWLEQQFDWEHERDEARKAIMAAIKYEPETYLCDKEPWKCLSYWQLLDRGRRLLNGQI